MIEGKDSNLEEWGGEMESWCGNYIVTNNIRGGKRYQELLKRDKDNVFRGGKIISDPDDFMVEGGTYLVPEAGDALVGLRPKREGGDA